MPKKQPTAAKRARTAARSGVKYTAALREAAGPDLPPHVDLFEDQALPEGEQMVVDGLRALAAAGEPLPLRFAEPAPEVAEALARAASSSNPASASFSRRFPRWASVQAAVDGYVLTETQYGPNRSGYTPTSRGPRVPVPVRAADGTVTVVAMPEWARLHDGRWIWAHTGWPLDAPGQIIDPPQEFAPAPGLLWEVAVYMDLGIEEGKVFGEDYGGSSGGWDTAAWCTSREDARQIARAYTAYRGHYARADVVEHGTDNGIISVTRDSFFPAPDAPERPRPARPAGPRPELHHTEVPEPAWYSGVTHPPNVSLHVWTGTAWKTLAWTQSGLITQNLGIGQGGPYEWAASLGPRHPDKGLHDWTQEGREVWGRYPDPDYQERSADIDTWRRAREDALVNALAERGGLTPEQAAARLAQGGEDYRQLLDVGQAVISRGLHTARLALPEGPERTAVRHALDDLTDRHRPPADAQRIADEQLDRETEKDRAPEVTAWCRRAVAEYLAPAPDPAAAGIDGFRPAAV
ncbi:hypothetical protein [Streptomyces sp.]|uniref:hypothetical protein n=1 Tax=Streptomyces sp. TaxID=1931 RepID=UPI002F3FA153